MKTHKCIFLMAMVLAGVMTAGAQVVINIDAAQAGRPISPMLYGIFFEDINHAADGGLYAELIANRSFEDSGKDIPAWRTSAAAGSTVKAQLTTEGLLNEKQHQALALEVKASAQAPVCLINEGFWGIQSVRGRTYRLSFWAKGSYKGGLKACLTDATGKQVYAEAPLDITLSKRWTRYTATLTANRNDDHAQFVLQADGKGSMALDVVSLFPPTFRNRENGCREDLAQLLFNLRPKFMRFPGGCFVEGQESPDNAFRWERTIGPIEEREGHLNRNWNYRTSDGLGFHEYLQLAEDLGAKPLYVVNVGLWHGGLTPVDSLQPWIDECMAALEYANGPVTSKYGAMRAKNGHPEPFNIEYLEIGNENNQPNPEAQSDRYYDRFKLFKDAVLAKYPQMHLIGNVVAWGDDHPKWGSAEAVELIDEHYYRSPAWFTENFRKYDDYARNSSLIYCGEYAVTQGFGHVGNLNAALGEAVFMMGMENNADVVAMASYAPIFVNEHDVAWQPDMIRFNAASVMCTPSYYVQQLMAYNIGTRAIEVEQSNLYPADEVASPEQQQCRVGVGTWATQATFDDIRVTVEDSVISDACDDISRFSADKGQWQTRDGALVQNSPLESCVSVLKRPVSGQNYSYRLRARKDAGNEGFLIVFNYVDKDNYCWFNLGGWNNTQHGLEQIVDGGKGQTATVAGHIETGRWYDVRIDVAKDSVWCYLDGQRVFASRIQSNTKPGIYTSASIDDATGDMIVKIANTSDQASTAQVNVQGYEIASANMTQLTSASGTDENTMAHPTNVYPVCLPLTSEPHAVQVFVPAYSLNILRLTR